MTKLTAIDVYAQYPNYAHKLINTSSSDLIERGSPGKGGDLGGYWYESLHEALEKWPHIVDTKLLLVAAYRLMISKMVALQRMKRMPVSGWISHNKKTKNAICLRNTYELYKDEVEGIMLHNAEDEWYPEEHLYL